MTYRILDKNGSIVNTILAEEEFVKANFEYYEEVPEVVVVDAKPIVETLSPRQARLVLLQKELLDDLETLIDGDKVLQIWWEYSLEIKRNDSRLLQVADAFGLTSEQLDEMFEIGGSL